MAYKPPLICFLIYLKVLQFNITATGANNHGTHMACVPANTFEYLLCASMRNIQSTVLISCYRVTHMTQENIVMKTYMLIKEISIIVQ